MQGYAWIIDVDHLWNATGEEWDSYSEAGTVGPSLPYCPDLRHELARGQGWPFRLLDDDGELCYTGRLMVEGEHVSPNTIDENAIFGPLWDFGEPNAGCTSIQYHMAGRWEEI